MVTKIRLDRRSDKHWRRRQKWEKLKNQRQAEEDRDHCTVCSHNDVTAAGLVIFQRLIIRTMLHIIWLPMFHSKHWTASFQRCPCQHYCGRTDPALVRSLALLTKKMRPASLQAWEQLCIALTVDINMKASKIRTNQGHIHGRIPV